MNIQIPHSNSKDETKKRLEALTGQLKTKYGSQIQDLKEEWTGFTGKVSGSAKGYSVTGTIAIEDALVSIDLKIPFLLQVFSKKIKSAVEEHVHKTLGGREGA
jgi:putative polyhydroxyalkanoate system protein